MTTYRTREKCLLCHGTGFDPIIDLGNLYLNGFPLPGENHLAKAPLNVIRCQECGLLQLRETVNPDLLYREYWYRSGTNQSMRDALKDVVSNLPVSLEPWDTVVDIGSNDNTLLASYEIPNLNRIGFEPSNIALEAAKNHPDITVLNEYFHAVKPLKGKAKVVTSIAMFYGLQDPHPFVDDVKAVLADDGVWVLQLAYLPSILERNAFDGICHEHVAYYSLATLERLLNLHGLYVFDAVLVPVNEGSIRLYVGKEPRRKSGRLLKIKEEERAANLGSLEPYAAFSRRVQDLGKRLVSYLEDCRKHGQVVHGYGASTKGNTLLQTFEIDGGLVSKVWERQPVKWGRETVTRIPIVSEEEGRVEKPDCLLVLPWHFAEEFVAREADYIAKGGKILIPLPDFQVVSRA